MASSPALPPGLASAQRAAEPAVDEKEIAMKAASPWLAHAAALGGGVNEWFYKGDDGTTMGPFDAATLRSWFDAGHLDEGLQIRRGGAGGVFLPLREFLVGGYVCDRCLDARLQPLLILPIP